MSHNFLYVEKYKKKLGYLCQDTDRRLVNVNTFSTTVKDEISEGR